MWTSIPVKSIKNYPQVKGVVQGDIHTYHKWAFNPFKVLRDNREDDLEITPSHKDSWFLGVKSQTTKP